MRLQDQIAIVTGAADGLGKAIALRLAEEGAKLVLLDIAVEKLHQVAAQIPGALAVSGDVTDEAVVESMFARIDAVHDRIDVLVNNVGGSRDTKLWDMTAEAWDATIRLNLRSTFLCTRAATRRMMPRKSGRIVCLSSGAREGTPWIAYDKGGLAYATAKAGIHGFIRDAAMELAQYGIRVNAVAPGPIETDNTREMFKVLEREIEHTPTRMTPMRRLGQPREVADAVLFLACEESSYITGVTLNVAGGR
jgi:NAD(P)-dependent dehydrogenase (short-subunit alcohol dehydrogenase family)